ncbi:hypothetical protein ABBQ32_000071 [Trebouxia sp. C0010 RCD-2024]
MQATAEVIDRVIHIVVTAQQPAATQIQRRQAVELSDQVGARWEEFTAEEHTQLASTSFGLLTQVGGTASSYAIRSKAAVVLALVTKRQGGQLLQALLPELIRLASGGATQAETVCIVLRMMAEEVTQYRDDLEADNKRQLLSALTACVPQVLPFLEQSMEGHFGQALAAAQQGQHQVSQLHAAVVTAALGTSLTYAEWAPLAPLTDSGLIRACAYFLTTQDFRLPACDILKQLTHRRQDKETSETYNSAMAATGEALVQAASAVLTQQAQEQLSFEGDSDEFGQRLCETMAEFGATHLHCLPTHDSKILFLQQARGTLVDMMTFTQHPYMLLSSKALPLWLALLSPRDAIAKQEGHAPNPSHTLLPLECVSALLDLAGEQLRKGVGVSQDTSDYPAYYEDHQDYKDFCISYRGDLARIVKLTAGLWPDQALAAASRRLQHALQQCSSSAVPPPEQHSLLEAAVLFTDSVVSAVCSAHLIKGGSLNQTATLSSTEALLQLLLGARFADPVLLNWHARSLESFSKLLAVNPELVQAVMQKAFNMYATNPLEGNAYGGIPPAKPTPQWKELQTARQRIGLMLVAHAKAQPQALLPHLAALANKTQELWAAGVIGTNEQSTLFDVVLAAASGADLQLQKQVVEWVLAGVRTEWQSSAFQAALDSPAAFISHYFDLHADAAGHAEVGGQQPRWQLYHHLYLIEHSGKRTTPLVKGPTAANPQDKRPPSPPPLRHDHPLTEHVDWMLPNLLRVCTCLHAVWTPQTLASLQGVRSAFLMGPKERAVYLRRPVPRGRQVVEQSGEEEAATVAGTNAAALRAWLRQVRESMYQSLGLMCTNVSAFYACGPAQGLWGPALMQHVECMDHQHLRMLLRHLMLSFTKSCPAQHRNSWLLPVLGALLPHMLERISAKWSRIVSQSGSSAPDAGARHSEDGAAANDEVVEERLIRELTREHLQLLLNMVDKPAPSPGGAGTGQSVLEWLLAEAPDLALAAVGTGVAALWWPDSDSGAKATAFCRAVVGVATTNERVYNFVGREMLQGGIAALAHPIFTTAETLQLIRDILAQQLATSPGPRQALLALPAITPPMLTQFEADVAATGSEKEQRFIIRKLLMQSGVGELQAALQLNFKPIVAAVVNVNEYEQRTGGKQLPVDQQGGDMGLGILTQ